jgi:hypothetical protein
MCSDTLEALRGFEARLVLQCHHGTLANPRHFCRFPFSQTKWRLCLFDRGFVRLVLRGSVIVRPVKCHSHLLRCFPNRVGSSGMKQKRKIIVHIATSADGYIARLDGDLDWLTSRPALKLREIAKTVQDRKTPRNEDTNGQSKSYGFTCLRRAQIA